MGRSAPPQPPVALRASSGGSSSYGLSVTQGTAALNDVDMTIANTSASGVAVGHW